MAIEDIFRQPWSMAWSTSTYLFEGLLSPLRNVREGESLSTWKVVLAELGYTFTLAVALVEMVARMILSLIGVPLALLLPLGSHAVKDPGLAGYVIGISAVGAIASALTAVNCLAALVQNLYKPSIRYSTLCIQGY